MEAIENGYNLRIKHLTQLRNNLDTIEILTGENERLKQSLNESKELHAKLWISFKQKSKIVEDCKYQLDNLGGAGLNIPESLHIIKEILNEVRP